MLGSSRVAAQLAASREGLGSMRVSRWNEEEIRKPRWAMSARYAVVQTVTSLF
jgi:hypothetical protein